MNRSFVTSRVLDGIVFVAAIAGIALNLKLMFATQADPGAGIGGCGGGGCAEVLGSRWSKAFDLPVTAFGVVAHFGILLTLTRHAKDLMTPLLGLVFGSVLWFTLVQALVLKSFCPLCLTAHGVALIECAAGWSRRALNRRSERVLRGAAIWSLTGFLAIALVQIYGPVPATHRVAALGEEDAPATKTAHNEGSGRMLVFESIRKSYGVDALPLLGNPNAKHVFVEYFDYACAACRSTSGYLDALMALHPDDVAVIALPVPLESTCNPAIPLTAAQHPGSCELSRLALAVWRHAPAAFPAYHRQRMRDPSLDAARRDAGAILPPGGFEKALADPWIDRLLDANISDWSAFSRLSDKLPKLLVPTGKIVHGPPSSQQDFIERLEAELGL